MKQRILLLSFMMCIFVFAHAQTRTVSGNIIGSDDSSGLPGVNITLKGTTTGTISDMDGNYKIEASESDVLIFSFIGYNTQEVTVGGRSSIDITLNQDATQLSEVVVTSLGIERERKSLTYSVSELKGKSLTESRESNIANSLSGKIAGVQVSKTASGASGSTRVIIRGNNVLDGNNQPLYVVDGVPIDNQNLQAAGRWGGIDYGDGVSDLNPDDIESMTVLKGGSATALYGFRAANGVILVTTKKGQNKEGIGVEYNSNFTFENALITPDVQNEYGHGIGGNFPTTQAEALSLGTGVNGTSWGARMTGQSGAAFWDGVSRPYSAQPDNIKDFYETGTTFTNTLVLSAGTKASDFRMSLSKLDNKGIVPTSEFERYSVSFRGTSQITDKLSADYKLTYIKAEAKNRVNMSDIMDNPANGLLFLPRSVPLSSLQPYKTEDGLQRLYTTDDFRLNPYFAMNENTNNDRKDRMMGYAALKYQFTDWLSLQLRSGTDFYASDRSNRVVVGTRYRMGGQIITNQFNVRENNSDFLVTVAKDVTEDISFSVNLGGNHLLQDTKQVGFDGQGLVIPGFYHISNAQTVTNLQNNSTTEVNSLYGAAYASYKNFLFLDASVRNDWFSSLAPGDVSALYSSAGLGLVLTEALNVESDVLSFAKIRASYATVGNGSPAPYLNSLTYGVATSANPTFGFLGSIDNQFVPTSNIPNLDPKPSSTKVLEFGADLRFFNDRLSFDFAYYKNQAVDQILRSSVSKASGFDNITFSAGQIDNKGFEFLVKGTPIQTSDLRWDLSFNFAKNENIVHSLAEGVDQFVLGQDRNVFITARPGESYALIEGYDYLRDDNGNKVFGSNGLPLRSEETEVLGTATPDWTGGIGTTLTYKGISFNALIDIRQGGEMFSISNRNATIQGNSAQSLEGRDAWYAGTGGYVGAGVSQDGSTNTVAVDPEVYWNTAPVIVDASDANVGTGSVSAQGIITDFIYDASYIKMREMSIGYTLPQSLVGNIFSSVKVSVVGRNLFFLKNNLPGFDPESNYNNGNAQGIESGSIPTTRSFGFNLNLQF
ncbi:TonB-linked outer membrane protein, SusC/RagA family [Reichenbachiella faecimaris]|uniref:TonB-linked outer membrane protein, SusC/RagA family n=1 Tax=Reichenbachiella faecimaris TaxID=692418 RepID=A0A1W2G5X4_REIFA|nr:SusC/RagA family TonB-linked outer membrane protein [Reichenbachiella faecimaris]SMD31934.1 TonB-linked outer membrane protein, SusC/RagA family [Reichenbachiella faecimaris]